MDAFLTAVESKLRGPFSSLEFSKAVQTHALKGGSISEYLHNVSQVLARADKAIQSRVLIGLLGLEIDDTQSSNSKGGKQVYEEIQAILEQAQVSPKHEEWVRMVAGLIEGILFTQSKEEAEQYYTRSCRGKEVAKQLSELCDQVCATVQEQTVTSLSDQEICPDLNASFVPYQYGLLPPSLIEVLVPEAKDVSKNPHFQVNASASILHIDQELEAQRAKEELEHQGPVLMKTKMNNSMVSGDDSKAAAAQKATTLPPGFRPTKLVSANSKSKAASASSMFMPKAKTNPLLAKRQLHQKTTLLRKKGAAQSLVNKTKVSNRVGGAPSSGVAASTSSATTPAREVAASTSSSFAASAAARFRAKRAAGNAGKMKMMDVSEVVDQQKQAAAATTEAARSKLSKKRRILEAAEATTKKTKLEEESMSTPNTSDGVAPSASAATPATPTTNDAAPPPQLLSGDEEWKVILRERSNKLSAEDRDRVQQFFTRPGYNPTPEIPVLKMKLHEQRSKDPGTGQEMKETFYIELDYQSFSSKQSRKVKRY